MSYYIYDDEKTADQVQQPDNKNKYDVSVIVATYRPIWKKLKLTLDSIIDQRGINMQILVADDGSTDNLFDKVSEYFSIKNFNNYILITSGENKGTVSNFLNACMMAKGKYIKGISPGDCLYKSDTLLNWVLSLSHSNKKWSFGNAAYYKMEGNIPHTVISEPHPQYVRPYKRGNDDECRWVYTVFYDTVLGAAVISERDVLIDYLLQINRKIIYAEDMVFRLMMFDGEVGFYYDDIVIAYEYGTGISTCGDDVWAKRIDKDIETADIELINHMQNKFQKKMIKTMLYRKKHQSKISAIFIKGKLKMYIYLKFFRRKTPDIDVSKLPYFNQEDEGQ